MTSFSLDYLCETLSHVKSHSEVLELGLQYMNLEGGEDSSTHDSDSIVEAGGDWPTGSDVESLRALFKTGKW